MSTKNQPGEFNCYERAEPDEPMFVLLGRDPVASFVVQFWIALREESGDKDSKKLAEAEQCSQELQAWARKKGKDTIDVRMLDAALKRLL